MWYELCGVSYVVQSMWCELNSYRMGRPPGAHGRQRGETSADPPSARGAHEAPTGGNVAKPRRIHPAHGAPTRRPRVATWRNLGIPIQFISDTSKND